MVRTRGAIFSCANWRTVERKSCSSSESRVSGEAGCDARTESATGIKLSLKWLPVQQGEDDFHFWSSQQTKDGCPISRSFFARYGIPRMSTAFALCLQG